MSYDNYLAGGFALFGAFLSWFLGSLDGVVKLLIFVTVIDQITGVIKAGILRKWSSAVGFNGIARKTYMFLLVGVAHVIDTELPGQTEILRDAISLFYVANEGLSIIENAIDCGVPVPEWFKERFQSWHDKQLISKNEPGAEED